MPGLNNEPGLKSARYASNDASDDENKEKLKSEMRRLGFKEMPAYFVCVLVMITSKDDLSLHQGISPDHFLEFENLNSALHISSQLFQSARFLKEA